MRRMSEILGKTREGHIRERVIDEGEIEELEAVVVEYALDGRRLDLLALTEVQVL